jgi:TetR/AcrR family transcriptional repressor of nem operon
MVGTKQFDHDAVVERAMMLFWRKGYSGTSIHDLEKATRLRRGSLYNAFGDKQGLFVAALKRYETTVGQERIRQLSNPDPYRAIEGFLDTLVTQMSEPSRPRGCLHTNTSLEFPNAPDEVLRIIAERTAGIEGAACSIRQPTPAPLPVSISGSRKASGCCTRCSATLRRCTTLSRLPCGNGRIRKRNGAGQTNVIFALETLLLTDHSNIAKVPSPFC